MISLDTEFDFWPEHRLGTLVACLIEASANTPAADPRKGIPAEDDTAFWVDCACTVLSDREELEDEQAAHIAEELAAAVHAEMCGRDFIYVRPGLYLGDLSGSESRLTMRFLQVDAVLTVASHAIERLWASDGIAYHTAILDARAEVGSCLPACCDFLDRAGTAFVCCASGQGLSLLVCAAHMATSRPAGACFAETPTELLRSLAARRGVLAPIDAAAREALLVFCAARPPPRAALAVAVDAAGATGEAGEAGEAPSTPASKSGAALAALALDSPATSPASAKRAAGGEEARGGAALAATPKAKVAKARAADEASCKAREEATGEAYPIIA